MLTFVRMTIQLDLTLSFPVSLQPTIHTHSLSLSPFLYWEGPLWREILKNIKRLRWTYVSSKPISHLHEDEDKDAADDTGKEPWKIISNFFLIKNKFGLPTPLSNKHQRRCFPTFAFSHCSSPPPTDTQNLQLIKVSKISPLDIFYKGGRHTNPSFKGWLVCTRYQRHKTSKRPWVWYFLGENGDGIDQGHFSSLLTCSHLTPKLVDPQPDRSMRASNISSYDHNKM